MKLKNKTTHDIEMQKLYDLIIDLYLVKMHPDREVLYFDSNGPVYEKKIAPKMP